MPSRQGNKERFVSKSGRYVLLEGTDPEQAEPAGALYLRDVVKGETVQLDAAEEGCGTCKSGGVISGDEPESGYATASAEDTRVFFMSNQGLTRDSSSGTDLYECEIVERGGRDKCNLTDLTPLTGGEPSGVVSVLGASEDGSWVYFAAHAKLAEGATAKDNCNAGSGVGGEGGLCNLYVYHDGVTKFIAELSPEDLGRGYDESQGGSSAFGEMRVRVSPNGRWLALMSNLGLTGYDNDDAVTGGPDEEVYLYHAPVALASETGTLSCASCDPTGARPFGSASTPQAYNNSRTLERETVHQPRFLSDSGRLFFEAENAIVPSDIDGVADVYEYEPENVPEGSSHACSPAQQGGSEVFKPAHGYEVGGTSGEEAAGCVALVSSGTSSEPSAFLDASETGSDVFFLTDSKLTNSDVEGGLSIFDAQECTSGAPCLPEAPVPPPPCETEASCKASPTPQPSVYGAPASATFSGPGNVTPEVAAPPKHVTKKTVKCKRGFIKKKTECVRSESKKRGKKAKRASRNRRTK